jgi:pilus assembly protein CpaF
VHANATLDAMARLETLASMSDVELPFAAVHEQVNQAIDVVVQLQRGSDGIRKIVEVAALVSGRREDFVLRPLMRWDADARAGTAARPGSFVRMPLPVALAERLRLAGEALPEGYVVEPAATDGLLPGATR